MTRAATLLPAVLAAFAVLPGAAHATVTCAYDAGNHRLNVTANAEGDNPAILRDGASIRVIRSNNSPVACTGPQATVENTDKIEMTALTADVRVFRISLKGGPFAPGYTAESFLSIPEIEIDVNAGGGHDELHVFGGDDADDVRAGTASGGARLNLNAGEALDDADVAGSGLDAIDVHGALGDDVLDARGGAGTGASLAGGFLARGGGDDDRLNAGVGVSRLDGDAGDDTLTGGPAADDLYPADGDDSVDGGDATDFVTYLYSSAPGVTVDLAVAGPQDTGEGLDALTAVEGVVGSKGPDVLRGTDGANVLYGVEGDDRLEGRGGADTLEGGWDADTAEYTSAGAPVSVTLGTAGPQATGGAGLDTLVAVEGLRGSDAADTLTGDAGPNRIDGGLGTDVLDGAGGVDTLSYASRKTPVAVRLDGVQNDGADPDGNGLSSAAEEGDHAKAFENAEGGLGADRLRALGSGANVLLGRGGDDRLDGGPGTDTLDGGAGLDTVSYAGRAEAVAVRLDGLANDGADPDGDGTSEPGEEADHATSVENATGGDGPDKLFAPFGGVNVLTGGPGADLLDAKNSTTTVDVLKCGTGADSHRSDASDTKDSCETPVP